MKATTDIEQRMGNHSSGKPRGWTVPGTTMMKTLGSLLDPSSPRMVGAVHMGNVLPDNCLTHISK